MIDETKKLKPVIFFKGEYNSRYRQDDFRQRMLLKAMTVTTDPNELRKAIGVKTVADVYRTLDKLSMRKEWHAALSESGIDFPSIAKGIKFIADSSESDAVRLKAFQTILRSLGMDKYEADEGSNTTWEEQLLTMVKNKNEQKVIEGKVSESATEGDYVVAQPVMPEEEVRKREEENKVGRSLYE